MAWIIHPNVGLSDLKFAMSQQEVARLLDPIQSITSTDTLVDGTLTEFRGMTMPVCNYRDGRLRCLDTHWSMAPMILDGEDLFALPGRDLLTGLEKRNGGAMEIYSVVYFLKIGLTACNYLDKRGAILPALEEDDDERGIGVFSPGAFDDMLPHAKPISFLAP